MLLFVPTETSAINIGGNTIHSGLRINLGTNLPGLKDKSKAALKNKLSELTL